MEKHNRMHVFALQVILAICITVVISLVTLLFVIASKSLDLNDKHKWMLTIVRYILYILTIQGSKGLSVIAYNVFHEKRELDVRVLQNINMLQLVMYAFSVMVLIINQQKFFAEDFPLIFVACLIVKYPDLEKKPMSANYGVGMACSFYEGYLMHVIPSDGGSYGGFEQNVTSYEATHGVVVPVKKLFVVITKSLYSPPNLELFNKPQDDVIKLESCLSLEFVKKDVAGVKDRIYKNSVYKLRRAGSPPSAPAYLVAECATPLHTLRRVMDNRDLYEELSDVNPDDVAEDFCNTLTTILSKSSECRDKIVLVFYDDTNPESNLAEVLLDKIRELEPNFENLIIAKK
ncbi:stimulator of interferon genes protein-like isoform X3 [Trichoplusia ni]|uniref:Stimulator of interferon genes protein-like isoform X3 n=1 Tax=Trichoplusia ni TaxID=7111 RepID=A0A7E5WM29_TRINI|nr:stimulator of interferon genes protein-like isoform X3 [Trichoplusia ni]